MWLAARQKFICQSETDETPANRAHFWPSKRPHASGSVAAPSMCFPDHHEMSDLANHRKQRWNQPARADLSLSQRGKRTRHPPVGVEVLLTHSPFAERWPPGADAFLYSIGDVTWAVYAPPTRSSHAGKDQESSCADSSLTSSQFC